MSNKPEPPDGFRLLTYEEKTKPMPEDAMTFGYSIDSPFQKAWSNSLFAGDRLPENLRCKHYATRTPLQPDSEPRDVGTPRTEDWSILKHYIKPASETPPLDISVEACLKRAIEAGEVDDAMDVIREIIANRDTAERETIELRQLLAAEQAAKNHEIERGKGWCREAIERRKERDAAQSALAEAKREASTLATSIWRAEYKQDAPEWGLCDSVAGIISQIDNMYAGVRSQRDEASFALSTLRKAVEDAKEKCLDLWQQINKAPHEARCLVWGHTATIHGWNESDCNCWKSRALNPGHDAGRIFRDERSGRNSGPTH